MLRTPISLAAGRLHVDEKLMTELQAIKEEVKPTDILLVVDAMTGQDAVNAAQTFKSPATTPARPSTGC